MSVVIMVLLVKYKYALPDNQKWQEHVLSNDGPVPLEKLAYAPTKWQKWDEHISHDCAAYEI